jgi:hypothetical protein
VKLTYVCGQQHSAAMTSNMAILSKQVVRNDALSLAVNATKEVIQQKNSAA